MSTTKNRVLVTATIILAVIAAAIWYFAVFSTKPEPAAIGQGNDMETSQESADDSMYANLKGDAFDEAYLADMIAHHDGAVNMSEQAMAATAHEEIRTLASNILQTQSQEIMKMREWQKEWNYKETMSDGHMNHGGAAMDMGGEMVEMMNRLQNLKGEEYDKEFLRQMIIHHEQAVDMSEYAETNAKHQEIKDFANGVIDAQTAEIAQMKQWQKEWGY